MLRPQSHLGGGQPLLRRSVREPLHRRHQSLLPETLRISRESSNVREKKSSLQQPQRISQYAQSSTEQKENNVKEHIKPQEESVDPMDAVRVSARLSRQQLVQRLSASITAKQHRLEALKQRIQTQSALLHEKSIAINDSVDKQLRLSHLSTQCISQHASRSTQTNHIATNIIKVCDKAGIVRDKVAYHDGRVEGLGVTEQIYASRLTLLRTQRKLHRQRMRYVLIAIVVLLVVTMIYAVLGYVIGWYRQWKVHWMPGPYLPSMLDPLQSRQAEA